MPNLIMRARLALALMLAVVVATGAQAQARDTVSAPRSTGEQTYFEFQVEKPARHAPGSAVPRYPPELKAAGVEGEVIAQFVVDTLGAPALTTFRVLKSSHGEFAESVKTALPGMRFVPAELRGRKVRQLVQQPFVFAIEKKDSSAATAGVLRAPEPPLAIPPATIAPPPSSGTVRGWTIAQRMTVDSGNVSPVRPFYTRVFGTVGHMRVEVEAPISIPMGVMVTLIDSALASVQRQFRRLGAAAQVPSPSTLVATDSSDLSTLGSFLKVVSHHAIPVRSANGVLTVAMEVLSFSDSTLDASLFAVPEGYELRDLSSYVLPARADSLRVAMTKTMFEQWADTTKVVPGVTTKCTAVPAQP